MPHADWLQAIPLVQRPVITIMAYVVLSIIPAVTLFLAVADMDLERRKAQPQPKSVPSSTYPQGNQGGYQGGYQGNTSCTTVNHNVQHKGGHKRTIPKPSSAATCDGDTWGGDKLGISIDADTGSGSGRGCAAVEQTSSGMGT